MIVAFFNYLFYPVLSRLLSPADFGDVQALISLITQSAIILGAFSVVAVNITTGYMDIPGVSNESKASYSLFYDGKLTKAITWLKLCEVVGLDNYVEDAKKLLLANRPTL